MSENRDIYRIGSLSLPEINMLLARLGDRLDRMEGLKGTPKIYSTMDGGGNKIINTNIGTKYGEVLTADLSNDSGLTVGPGGLRTDLNISTNVFNPTNVQLAAGTYVVGDCNSVKHHNDGLFYEVREVSATPGFDIIWTFDNVSDFNQLVIKYNYEGSSTHFIALELYNVNTKTYNELHIFSTTGVASHYNWKNITAIEPANYIDPIKTVKVRINHFSAGNTAYYFYVDYLALVNYTI